MQEWCEKRPHHDCRDTINNTFSERDRGSWVESYMPIRKDCRNSNQVNILIETADRVPNILFLVNASKAIFTLLDKKGWDDELSEKALSYLRIAYKKGSKNAKVISAFNLYQQVAKRYGQEIQPIDAMFDYV